MKKSLAFVILVFGVIIMELGEIFVNSKMGKWAIRAVESKR